MASDKILKMKLGFSAIELVLVTMADRHNESDIDEIGNYLMNLIIQDQKSQQNVGLGS